MKNLQDFNVDDTVDVTRNDQDLFNNDFTGNVIGFHSTYIIVEDQDGEQWDCDPNQLSISS